MSEISESLRDIVAEASEQLSIADKARVNAAINRAAVYLKVKLNTSLTIEERDEAERNFKTEAGTVADILQSVGLERRNRFIARLIDTAIESSVKVAMSVL